MSERQEFLRSLAWLRKNIKVGQKINILTNKSATLDSPNGKNTGCVVEATVIGVENKRFCSVKLPSGVREEILWVDLLEQMGGKLK